jgi:hypothetical protein
VLVHEIFLVIDAVKVPEPCNTGPERAGYARIWRIKSLVNDPSHRRNDDGDGVEQRICKERCDKHGWL